LDHNHLTWNLSLLNNLGLTALKARTNNLTLFTTLNKDEAHGEN